MLQFQEYNIVWMIYLLASLGMAVLLWQFFCLIKWAYLRNFLRLTAIILLLTPAIGGDQYWAPAWIIAALQLLFNGVEAAMPAARILLLVWALCLTTYTMFKILFIVFRAKESTAERISAQTHKINITTKSHQNHRNRRSSPRLR